MKKAIEAVVSVICMAIAIGVLIHSATNMAEMYEPTNIVLPPPEPNPERDPEAQKLIDLLRKLTESPALHRIPYVADLKNEKVLM